MPRSRQLPPDFDMVGVDTVHVTRCPGRGKAFLAPRKTASALWDLIGVDQRVDDQRRPWPRVVIDPRGAMRGLEMGATAGSGAERRSGYPKRCARCYEQ